MHPLLNDASPETLNAIHAVCDAVAVEIHDKATPDNFRALVAFGVDKWIDTTGVQEMNYTDGMREILHTVALDALSTAFGFENLPKYHTP